MKTMTQRRKKEPIIMIIIVALALMFVFSTVMLIRELIEVKQEVDTLHELSLVKQQAMGETDAVRKKTTAKPSPSSDDDAVKEGKKAADESGEQQDPTEIVVKVEPWTQTEPVASGKPSEIAGAEGDGQGDGQYDPEQMENEISGSGIMPQYVALYEQNSELFGWITIPGTNIDYPVMHSPTRRNYYLSHDFYGNRVSTGVPFMDEECDPEGDFFLIYGHHPSLGTMFSHIIDYEDKSFWETHQEIYFDTLYEERLYVVVAAIRARVLDQFEKDGFRYYDYVALNSPQAFDEYMSQVRERALYDTGIDVSFGDELLVLSTCYHYTRNGRFVIVAKRVYE